MAKMKNKKAEEQVDWNSPPPSPKAASKEPVTEPIPASPASLLLSEETTEPTLTESTPEDLARSSDSPNVAKIDEKPVEGSTLEPSPPEPATEGILAEGPLAPPSPPQSEVPSPLEEEETEPAPEAVKEDEIPDNRGQAEGVNSDPVAEPASEPASEEAPVATDSLSVETDQPATQETETLEPTSTEVAEGSVEESLPPAEERPSEENTREVVETTADPVPVTAESTVKSLPKQKEIVEDVKGPEPIPEDTVKEVKELDPLPVEVSVKAALEAPEVPFEVPQAAAEAPETTIAPPEPPVERPVEIPIFAPVEAKSPPRPKAASPILPEEHSFSPRSIVTERPPVSNTFLRSPPKPSAINHIIEDSRPPSAPSPPVTRARPRYNTSAFETDSEDDSALIRPRLRDEALSRESSRGPNYPPTQPRSLFASRVPVEHYSSPPPPPPPPPGYHHSGYYPPAPPYYHGPSHMRQPGGYPQHSPYGPSSHVSHTSHSSSPYPETWQHPPHYGPYGTHSPRRHDSLSSRDFGRDFGGLPTLENGPLDDETNVFSRLSQAIPDLHVLLAKYKETHGQLGVREELLRRADAEQQEKLRAKDQEIQSLRERVTRLESKHSIEASKLRLEIGNMEDQVKELKEQLAETVKFKSEAEKLRATLDRATKYWESRHKELEEAHSTLKKLSTEEAAKSRKEFDEWRSTATTKHDAEKIALAIQFDKKLKEADVSTDNLRQDAAAAFAKEKDALKRQQREREANFDNVRKELESKLGSAQLDREQALKREREGMEAWAKERGNLVQSHREDIQSLRMSIKNEADKSWIDLHAEANRKAEERNALAEQLMKEKDGLQKQYNALKAESGKERDIIKSVVGNLESEKARLEKLMECYGDIAEIKSKGDTY
ncbi:hypothetical protein P280DRAFT_233791 [Massarina eburnea CBS 473.64]|uniref:Uncharacterized protein n=1 Tax=Massarina eburnea CBS 473.64 TaxID=1395130 RepID=A0A6A6RJQ4_9PLEO|nr:hypothetical protein P280DRAFT_233791 [Massarina eburnea CBS 473.64]